MRKFFFVRIVNELREVDTLGQDHNTIFPEIQTFAFLLFWLILAKKLVKIGQNFEIFYIRKSVFKACPNVVEWVLVLIFKLLQPNNDGTLVLTSSPWRAPYSILWSLGEFFDRKLVFKDDDYAEFSKVKIFMTSFF